MISIKLNIMNCRLENFFVIIMLALLAACSKNDSGQLNSDEEEKTLNDIAYGNDPKQKMDVYLPAGRSTGTPVVVLLHGGGFVAGDRKDFTERAIALRNKGYIVLNLSYRLVDTSGIFQTPLIHKPSAITIKAQINDVAAAVSFARSKSEEWVMSNANWGIAGHSAGASLALLYAYDDRNKEGPVKAVANWAGATSFAFNDESEFDLLDPRLVEVYYRAIGAEPVNSNKLAFMAHSPDWIVILKKNVPPTLNIRPENNAVFGVDVSKPLYISFTRVLNDNKVPNKYVEIAGADHGFGQPGNWDRVYNETDAFFRQHIK